MAVINYLWDFTWSNVFIQNDINGNKHKKDRRVFVMCYYKTSKYTS